MEAIYEGVCEWCRGPIEVGDDIDRVADNWLHTSPCVEEARDQGWE